MHYCAAFIIAAAILVASHPANASDPSIERKVARSLIAETAQVLELDRAGRVPRTFTAVTLDRVAAELESSARKLDKPAADLLMQAVARISERDPPALRAIAAQLLAMERNEQPR